MKNMSSLYIAVGALLLAIMFVRYASAQSTTSSTNADYFAAVPPTFDPNTDGLYITGERMPDSFLITCYGTDEPRIPNVPDLRFVLIRPGSFELDGLALDVDRQFYIATTELSQLQYAALSAHLGDFESYADYGVATLWRARLDPNVIDVQSLVEIGEYVELPNRPAIGLSVEDAADCTTSLSRRTGMVVRLPSMGEWIAVASNRRKDALLSISDIDSLAWRSNSPGKQTDLEFLRDVSAGSRNALGLCNVFGNVAELVWPTSTERQRLRSRFGPSSTEPTMPEHDRRGYTVGEYTAFALGGAVNTPLGSNLHSLSVEEARQAFVKEVTKLDAIVLHQQLVARVPWGGHSLWASGVRFVIEAPPGEVGR